MTDLGTVQGTDSIAWGINSSGVVVGHSVDGCPGAPCGPNTAFIYENGVMLDLNDLIPAGSGVHLRTAGGINDSGQIVAVSDVPNAHAFLLTPVVAVKADTTTTITSDTPDPSVVGQPYTVSWTVTVNAPGSGTPTGSVTVSDGTGATCQAAVATGSCSLTSASAGAKTLTATYSGDGNFNGSSASTSHQVDAADLTPPMVTCGPGDAGWHAANVSIACTASDSGSGLANPGDASFSLSTSVPAGTEDANALTDSRQVCDNAGNCTTVGPYGANKIDRKAPAIALNMPANGATYLSDSL